MKTLKKNSHFKNAKPFLKWAGGKGQLLEQFENYYPEKLKKGKIKEYFEPFLGGGAVFFDIVQKYNIEKAYLYDINPELILAYVVIQKEVETLLDFLTEYEQNYIPLEKKDRNTYYYDIRETFNRDRFDVNYKKFSDNWIPRAAQLIFLNKTCYNGLFRFNNSGGFNTPVGDYKNPTICDRENLKSVSEVLQIAEIKCAGYEEVQKDIKTNSFIYFDPPYRPLSKTSSFTSYSKHQFNDEHQRELAKIYELMDSTGNLVMLSNSDPKNTNKTDNFFDKLYKKYTIERIRARRNINSKASKRGILSEIVVTNY